VTWDEIGTILSVVGGVGALAAGAWAALQTVLLQQWKQAQQLEVEHFKGARSPWT
jgi:hypothetical protein